MAEYIANEPQIVEVNQNILFTDTTVPGNNSIMHRPGSGLITLRGITNQCRARYKITFGGNFAVPADGTNERIGLAIAINGEPITSTTMLAEAYATQKFFNVGRSLYLEVPKNCCSQISVKNISGQKVIVQNASIIVERVA